MGGIFGACLDNECVMDIFFGTDYHSHLGARRGGMAVFDGKHYNRAIHNIENSPFRTKFESDIPDMKGRIGGWLYQRRLSTANHFKFKNWNYSGNNSRQD